VFHHKGGAGYLTSYDVTNDIWEAHGNQFSDSYHSYITATIDPVDRVMVAIGSGHVNVWKLGESWSNHFTIKTALPDGTVPSAIHKAYPGVSYDPNLGEIVLWGEGQSVFTLKIDASNLEEGTHLWTKRATPAASANPGSAARWGTFGRFQYVPHFDLYIVVNGAQDEVYFYRMGSPENGGTGDDNPNDDNPGDDNPGDDRERTFAAVDVNPHASEDREKLFQLKAGEWYEIAGSKLENVFPKEFPPGNSGARSVMSAWNSGVYDTHNKQLLVYSGGHADYAGNEVYDFDTEALIWRRLTNPTHRDFIASDNGTGYYDDGLPRSRHTYDSLEFVPELNAMCAFGVIYTYRIANSYHNTDCFNVTSHTWERKADPIRVGGSTITGYDSVTRWVFHHKGGAGFLSSYDVVNDEWKAHGTQHYDSYHSYVTAAIDTENRLMIAMGSGHINVWNIDDDRSFHFTIKTELPNGSLPAPLNSPYPGVVYDSKRKQIALWSGGSTVYTLALDMDNLKEGTHRWTAHAVSSQSADPGEPSLRGTYGRFQYVPHLDLYMVVNATNKNVFFYKLGEDQGDQSACAGEVSEGHVSYDAANRSLGIRQLEIGGKHFSAKLKVDASGLFKLENIAAEIGGDTFIGGCYLEESQTIVLPKISVDDAYYEATLIHSSDWRFYVDSVGVLE